MKVNNKDAKAMSQSSSNLQTIASEQNCMWQNNLIYAMYIEHLWTH